MSTHHGHEHVIHLLAHKYDVQPLSGNAQTLVDEIHNLLISDTPEGRQMRSAYYPILKTADDPPKEGMEDKVVSFFFKGQWPKFGMTYFDDQLADWQSFVDKPERNEVVLNRQFCEAYEQAIHTDKEGDLVHGLKYFLIVSIYHELAHVFFRVTNKKDTPREISYEKLVSQIAQGFGVPETGESGHFVIYKLIGGLPSIDHPLKKEGQSAKEFMVEKFAHASHILLQRYEESKAASYDEATYRIKSTAISEKLKHGVFLSHFQSSELEQISRKSIAAEYTPSEEEMKRWLAEDVEVDG